jgi:hypothetical protein
MPRIELDIETSLSPEKVRQMLIDFSPQRPEVWPGLWEGAYQVISVGETTAEVREGNKSPRIWARERYDWSTPGLVRWEVLESNFCTPGSFVEARLSPGPDGGTKVHIVWERTPTTIPARLGFVLIMLTRGAPVRSSIEAAFKKAGG